MSTCRHEYTCAKCGETFHNPPGWGEDDALMEYQEAFTEEMRSVDTVPPAIVCDDCYKAMLAELPPEQAFREHQERNA